MVLFAFGGYWGYPLAITSKGVRTMAQSPISPSPFDKVIKAVSSVKTKRGLVAFTILLLFLCFIFSLFLAKDTLQWVLTIMFLVFIVGYSAFATFAGGQSGD